MILGKLTRQNRICRWYCKEAKIVGLAERPEPRAITQDYIGPPDANSNLRPYVRCIPPNETPIAARLRHDQEELAQWNQDFWARHNKRFYDERNDFIRLHKLAGIEEISADKMSEFYKTFLDKNKKLHAYYNVSWYIKNFNLLVLSLQVKLAALLPKRKKIHQNE